MTAAGVWVAPSRAGTGAPRSAARRTVGEIRHPLDSPVLPGVEGVRSDESMLAQPDEAHSIVRRQKMQRITHYGFLEQRTPRADWPEAFNS